MAQRRTLEIAVGAFIVTGLGLLVFFIFTIGDFATYLQPGYTLTVSFDSANGITQGSPVQYAGVEVGKVREVKIVYDTEKSKPQVHLLVRLPSDVHVRNDDIAAISTFGLLGEKYLEVTPGPGVGQILEPNGRLVGKPPVSTEDIIERSSSVLTELKQTLEGVNNLVGDKEATIFLKEAIQEARDATRHWRALGERLNIAMMHAESGQGSLGKIMYDDELYQRMILFVEDLRAHPWKLLVKPKKSKAESNEQKSN